MLELHAEFGPLTLIYEGAHSVVYRGNQAAARRRVILKVLKERPASAEALIRYRQEYEITHKLDFREAIRAFELRPHRSTLVIVLEDFGGDSLQKVLARRRLSLEEALSLGARVASQLAEVHARGIIHKDICPGNIVWNEAEDVVKIIDYGVSSVFSREDPQFESCAAISGTVSYVAPEQTGRMNRSLDQRADLYALGATLHEFLTGRPPFTAADPLEMVHCHLARMPRPLHEIAPDIPEPVSRIVMKLLQKTAEERYQSAQGVQRDLERCLAALRQHEAIPLFPLGAEDTCATLEPSRRLHGRGEAIGTVLAAFERAASGARELLLVSGPAGIGKTSVVQEVHRPITHRRGFYIHGKFDQLSGDVPYAALVAAFRVWTQQLLMEDEAEFRAWRERIQAAVGALGQVLTAVLPEIERLIGPQPTVPEAGLTESRARFAYVFRNFVRAICAPEHPLVIFLDDLQWADASSLHLIDLLLTDDALSHMVLIAAYRDEEIDPAHPAAMMLAALEGRSIRIGRLALGPLSAGDMAQLLADTLHQTREAVEPLAAIMMSKTGGNPFFALQFLKTLRRRRLLAFDPRRGWSWDAARIEAEGLTDNVVELVIRRLRELPPRTQEALSAAAILGARFDLRLLSSTLGEHEAATYDALRPALQDGIVEAASPFRPAAPGDLGAPLVVGELRFSHDRVQQAAAALLPEAARPALHLRIGRLLWQQLPAGAGAQRLCEAAAHLNAGRASITALAERDALLRLNVEAALAATAAQAPRTAADLLALVMEDAERLWALDPDLALRAALGQANAEALIGRFEAAERLAQGLLERLEGSFGGDRLRKAEVYVLLIRFRTLEARYAEAYAAATEALRMFGIELPTGAAGPHVAPSLARVERALAGRALSSIVALAETDDPEVLAIMALLSEVCPPSWFFDGDRFMVVALHLGAVILERGLTRLAAGGLAMFSQVLLILGRPEDAATVGRAAVEIADRYGDPAQGAQARNIYTFNTGVWVEHLRAILPVFDLGIQQGLIGGVPTYSGFMVNNKMLTELFAGLSLEPQLARAWENLRFAETSATRITVHVIEAVILILANLTGHTRAPEAFHFGGREEEDFLRVWREHRSNYALVCFLMDRGLVRLLLGEPAKALVDLEASEPLLIYVAGHLLVAKHAFLFALALALSLGEPGEADGANRGPRREKLEALAAQLDAWAELCPANYRHMAGIVRGEIARLDGDWVAALARLEAAAEDAAAHGFLHHEALAEERLAALWFARGRDAYGKLHVLRARRGYELWGARVKVAEIDRRFPDLARRRAVSLSAASMHVEEDASFLDVVSVVKATQAISAEIALDRLLATLLRVVLEAAGADKGALLLADRGALFVEAEGRVEDERFQIEQHVALESWTGGPRSIVQYVARTRESLVIGDAQADPRLEADAHLRASGARSILCAPILKQGNLLAVLFLANHAAPDAFTQERLALLRILAGQAAVSLENARLLEREVALRVAAEEAVKLRDDFLMVASHELRTPLTSLMLSVQSMRRTGTRVALPPDFERLIERSQRQGARLSRLIHELLDVSRLQAGVLELDPAEVDLCKLTTDVVRRMEPDLAAARCAFSLQGDATVFGYWDRARLDQVLTSLLGNAIKFGPGRPIEAHITQRDGWARFELCDHGIGMDEVEQAHVFEQFHRAVSARSYGGLGLGLFLAKKLVEAHGGRIAVESKKGEGATFIVELPCLSRTEDARPAGRACSA